MMLAIYAIQGSDTLIKRKKERNQTINIPSTEHRVITFTLKNNF